MLFTVAGKDIDVNVEDYPSLHYIQIEVNE
jgi:hypothetical protein